MIDINRIRQYILLHGHIVADLNLNRTVKELVNESHIITQSMMKSLINETPLNSKYTLELSDISEWYSEHFPRFNKLEHRRHIVYCNDKDYTHRFQCISLFQILDDIMIVYQRSADVEKMIDDFRFFVEIKNRYFPFVDVIHIHYGSLHIKIENND